MNENRVFALHQPDEIDDPLTEILRSGAKRLVQQAVEAEFAALLARHDDLELPDGRRRVVRHGHDPARPIQTGIGPVEVAKPKARDSAGRRRGPSASAMRRRSCRNGRGGRRVRPSRSSSPRPARRSRGSSRTGRLRPARRSAGRKRSPSRSRSTSPRRRRSGGRRHSRLRSRAPAAPRKGGSGSAAPRAGASAFVANSRSSSSFHLPSFGRGCTWRS